MKESDHLNRRFYDNDSAIYDGRWVSRGGKLTSTIQQSIVTSLCGSCDGQRVLEIGPGTGRFSMSLASNGARLNLLDLSTSMLLRARSRLEAAGLLAHVDSCVAGSVYSLPFPDSVFDIIITINVVNHLESLDTALSEIARVLRPGGTLVFNYASLYSMYLPAGLVVNMRRRAFAGDVYSAWRTSRSVIRSLNNSGFSVDAIVGHLHVPRALDKPIGEQLLAPLDRLCRSGVGRALAPVQFVRALK